MKIRLFVLPAILLGLSGCSTMYYGAMEKLGVHKQNSYANGTSLERKIMF